MGVLLVSFLFCFGVGYWFTCCVCFIVQGACWLWLGLLVLFVMLGFFGLLVCSLSAGFWFAVAWLLVGWLLFVRLVALGLLLCSACD